MKIALIAYGFSGSTLPLIRELRSRGHSVTCYYLVDPFSSSIEGLEFEKKCVIPGIHKINSFFVKDYFGDEFMCVYAVVLLRKRSKIKVPFVNKAIGRIDGITINRVCKKIRNENYNIVNIVGHMRPMDVIGSHLSGINIIYSFHEIVQNHTESYSSPFAVVSYALKQNLPIIVHSSKSFNDIQKAKINLSSKSNIILIHFGKFDSFLHYKIDGNNELNENYLLYIGYILPYKGLSVLYQSIKILEKDNNLKYKILVAGKGYDSILIEMKKDNNFLLENTYISNNSLVNLILSCKAVVCPYLSASQSGIPHVASLFGKPVIATSVGAFPEVIKSGINGVLVPPNDDKSLAIAINNVMNDSLYYKQLTPSFLGGDNRDEYEWGCICTQYEDLFKKILDK